MADANHAQRGCRPNQRFDEGLRRLRGKPGVECRLQEELAAEFLDKTRLVTTGRQQMRGGPGPQHPRGMRMKGQNHSGASHLRSRRQRPMDQGLMAKMHAVKDADGHAQRTRNIRKFRKRMKGFHAVEGSVKDEGRCPLRLPAAWTLWAGSRRVSRVDREERFEVLRA